MQNKSTAVDHPFLISTHLWRKTWGRRCLLCMTTLPLCTCHLQPSATVTGMEGDVTVKLSYFLFSGSEVAGCQLRAEVIVRFSGTSSEPVNHWLSCQEYYISSQPPRLVTNNVTIFNRSAENRNVVFATLYRYIGAFNISPGIFVNAASWASYIWQGHTADGACPKIRHDQF